MTEFMTEADKERKRYVLAIERAEAAEAERDEAVMLRMAADLALVTAEARIEAVREVCDSAMNTAALIEARSGTKAFQAVSVDDVLAALTGEITDGE